MLAQCRRSLLQRSLVTRSLVTRSLVRRPFPQQSFVQRSCVWVLLACFAIALGCSSKEANPAAVTPGEQGASTTDAAAPGAGNAGKKSSVTLILNWYPEAEHGGFYAAAEDGFFGVQGLEVTIQPGGRTVAAAGELLLDRVQYAVVNADDVALMRNEGADVVALMAPMQNHPRCLLVRQDAAIEGFNDLKGLTLLCETGRPFVEFMRQKGVLDGVQEAPYFGSVAPMAADAKTAVQGYIFSEPLLAKQQGIEVKTLMVSDLGFNPYASILITTGKRVREQPAEVKQMVQACIDGWKRYLEEPSKANARILKENDQGMTAEALAYGVEKLMPLCVPSGTDANQVGVMTSQRWDELVSQLVELKMVDASKVKASDCYDLKFLPKP
jgi:NitT/TauT family transport system substrate-binding protein